MNEAGLKGQLAKSLRAELPGAVVYRHEDSFTAGIPDLSVTWRGRTVWVEVKLDRPGRKARVTEAQHQALAQLPGYLVTYGSDSSGLKSVRIAPELGLSAFHTDACWSRLHQYVVHKVRQAVQQQHEQPFERS